MIDSPMQPPQPPSDRTRVESLAAEMEVRGYCVLDHVIPTVDCETIRDEVLSIVSRDTTDFPYARDGIGFCPDIVNHTQSFAGYLLSEPLATLLSGALGEHWRVSFMSAIVNEPGNERGGWHADWPFNQGNAGRVPAPYPDRVMHFTTIWMLAPFTNDNGATWVLPGSHRRTSNPTAASAGSPQEALPGEHDSIPGEMRVVGAAGSVLIMDSRLWHATGANLTDVPRPALIARFAPWWLNLDVLRIGSEDRRRMCDETGQRDNFVPLVHRSAFSKLPRAVQQLFRHWVEPQSPYTRR